MHPQSINATGAPPLSSCPYAPEHDWRLLNVVRTATAQVETYQCQRCSEQRRDMRLCLPLRGQRR